MVFDHGKLWMSAAWHLHIRLWHHLELDWTIDDQLLWPFLWLLIKRLVLGARLHWLISVQPPWTLLLRGVPILLVSSEFQLFQAGWLFHVVLCESLLFPGPQLAIFFCRFLHLHRAYILLDFIWAWNVNLIFRHQERGFLCWRPYWYASSLFLIAIDWRCSRSKCTLPLLFLYLR